MTSRRVEQEVIRILNNLDKTIDRLEVSAADKEAEKLSIANMRYNLIEAFGLVLSEKKAIKRRDAILEKGDLLAKLPKDADDVVSWSRWGKLKVSSYKALAPAIIGLLGTLGPDERGPEVEKVRELLSDAVIREAYDDNVDSATMRHLKDVIDGNIKQVSEKLAVRRLIGRDITFSNGEVWFYPGKRGRPPFRVEIEAAHAVFEARNDAR